MATNTRQARREAEQKRKVRFDNYLNDFKLLYHNSVKIENLPADLPKRYLIRVLFEKGGIAYDKETGLYLPYVYGGIDTYGLPKYYNLIGYDGLTFMRKADEVVILRANDETFAPTNYIEQQCNALVDFDMAIFQNLEAIKTMTIIEVQDHATLLSMGNLAEARQVGASLVVVNKSANLGNTLNASGTGAQYLIDKLMQDRLKILNETLMHIGISTANTEKAERVQSIEVTASHGRALEHIKTLIDTFNHDAEVGGLSIRLRANTALMEEHDAEMKQLESEDNETENNEKDGDE